MNGEGDPFKRYLGAGSAGLGDWLEVAGENPFQHFDGTPQLLLSHPLLASHASQRTWNKAQTSWEGGSCLPHQPVRRARMPHALPPSSSRTGPSLIHPANSMHLLTSKSGALQEALPWACLCHSSCHMALHWIAGLPVSPCV